MQCQALGLEICMDLFKAWCLRDAAFLGPEICMDLEGPVLKRCYIRELWALRCPYSFRLWAWRFAWIVKAWCLRDAAFLSSGP